VSFCSLPGSLPVTRWRGRSASRIIPSVFPRSHSRRGFPASSFQECYDGWGLHHAELGFDSPSLTIRTGLAERRHTFLLPASALSTCSCSLWLSPSGKLSSWRSFALNLPCVTQEFHTRRHGARCAPTRWPKLARPCYGFSLLLACVGSRPVPRLLAAWTARQTGRAHCAAVSSRRSVYTLWRNCHFGTVPARFRPGSGHSWHRRSGYDHRPIREASVGPGACLHAEENSTVPGRYGSKKLGWQAYLDSRGILGKKNGGSARERLHDRS
jgi:hypothetical protein